jgi:hypothetical protein
MDDLEPLGECNCFNCRLKRIETGICQLNGSVARLVENHKRILGITGGDQRHGRK